jgi:hypothetical protein
MATTIICVVGFMCAMTVAIVWLILRALRTIGITGGNVVGLIVARDISRTAILAALREHYMHTEYVTRTDLNDHGHNDLATRLQVTRLESRIQTLERDVPALRGRVTTLERRVGRLQRQLRQFHWRRVTSEHPFDVWGALVGALVGLIVAFSLPSSFYRFVSDTFIYLIGGKVTRIDHVVSTDYLKYVGVTFAVSFLGFLVGRVIMWRAGRTEQVRVDTTEPEGAEAELP